MQLYVANSVIATISMLIFYIKHTNSALLLGRENNAWLYITNKYVRHMAPKGT